MCAARTVPEVWAEGSAYDAYVGRWSRIVGSEFVRWLGAPPRGRWLDVGCGSGALTEAILGEADPSAVLGIDRSSGFVSHARARTEPRGGTFVVGDARALPVLAGRFDVVVSGLVLNFVPDPARMVAEMARAARPGSPVGLFVWDYAAGMEAMRHFWNAAVALDPSAVTLDEGVRFPICAPGPLEALLDATGLLGVSSRPIEVPTRFRDFDDFWLPFLGGQGPAPAYAVSLPEGHRAALRDRIRDGLPVAPDGSIRLTARAWAVRGSTPTESG